MSKDTVSPAENTRFWTVGSTLSWGRCKFALRLGDGHYLSRSAMNSWWKRIKSQDLPVTLGLCISLLELASQVEEKKQRLVDELVNLRLY